MKYIANPVQVEALRIVKVHERKRGNAGMLDEYRENGINLDLENGDTVFANDMMRSRMEPKPGDYWVIQEDGYTYLNPRAVFERKYSPLFGSGARLYVILAHHGVGTMHTTADLDRDEILNLSPQQITQRYMEPAAAALQNSYRAFDGPALPLPPAKQEQPR